MRPQIRRLLESAGFSPRQLFAALQGAWLEPTPGYIWQENTGVTPTTTGGQTIGLMLDQSQGAALGADTVSNGTFETDISGWIGYIGTGTLNNSIISWVNSSALVTNNTGSTASCRIRTADGITVSTGKTYQIQISITSKSSAATIGVGISTSTGASVAVVLGSITATGAYTYTWLATGTYLAPVAFSNLNNNESYSIDSVSVREILGNHAAQPTAANRPTYQLDSNGLPLARHDTTDSLVVSLPNLGSGVFSAAGSVYFATPVGMSALHNQSMGTTYQLPALSTDIYSWIVVPQRLSTVLEGRLERYMLRKAGLAAPNYLTDDLGEILTDDIGDPLLAG